MFKRSKRFLGKSDCDIQNSGLREKVAAVPGERVAEISGFATDLPQSAYLAHTIRRAISAAEQRFHRYVTLEHLLLALLDDPDALALMEGARADLAGLRGAATETVNHSLATLYTPGRFDLRPSYKVERVLQSASDDARRVGCAEVDGAFVAVALFHETDSPAYDLLKRHNFVFHAANAWLDRNRNGAVRPPVAARDTTAVQEASAPVVAADTADVHNDVEEPDEEILLDEIVEDVRSADAAHPPAPKIADTAPVQAKPDQAIEPVTWPVIRPSEPTPSAPSSGDTGRRRSDSASPPRPLTTHPAPAAPMRSQEQPDVAARRPSMPQKQNWEIGPAVESPSLERGTREKGLRAPEPVPSSSEGRIEPRLPAPQATERTLEETRREQMRAPKEPARRSEPMMGSASPDLSAASAGRDRSLSARINEAADGRPTPSHATARDRSAASRPAAPQPVPRGAEHGARNGALRGSRQSERDGMQSPPPSSPGQGSPAPRSEPTLAPTARLDDMRVRPGAPPPPPAPAPAAKTPAKKPAAARDKDTERGARNRRRPQSAAAVYAGKLAENIPRKMRAHRSVPVEVRISREETDAFMAGFEGGGELVRHNIGVTQAMSVMLRAPDGGFIIENLGPETQWIFRHTDLAEKDAFGRWNWSVTPTETGRRRLQLVVASRSVDENGLAGDTVLPDQVITVRVGTNYVRSFGRIVKWVVLMALGGAITEGTMLLLRLLGGG